jgi:hypothetical protein
LHASVFRLAGEIYHLLAGVECVVASVFHRTEDEDGEAARHCLLTTSIEQAAWADVNFGDLGAIHLPSSFNRFEGRRDLSQAGRFQPVEPLAPEESTSGE